MDSPNSPRLGSESPPPRRGGSNVRPMDSPPRATQSTRNTGLSRPSRTLYVRDIPKGLEPELFDKPFREQIGLRHIRRMPHFAFVEFESVEAAMRAFNNLKDFKYRAEDRPISLDYDKDARDKDEGSFNRKRKIPENREGQQQYPREGSSYPSASAPYHERDRDMRERDRGPPPSTRDRERERERERFPSAQERVYERTERHDRNGRERDYPVAAPSHERSRERFMGRPESDMRGGSRPIESSYNPELLFQQQAGLFRFPFTGISPLSHFGQAVPSFPMMTSGQENSPKTLFVSGLPNNVTEREMNILFRFMTGFGGVRLIFKEGKSPICFVDFANGACATAAKTILQGYQLDRDGPGILLEYDRGNKSDRDNYGRDKDRRSDREEKRQR